MIPQNQQNSFYVHIASDGFYLSDGPVKPEHALQNLTHIDEVFSKNLPYSKAYLEKNGNKGIDYPKLFDKLIETAKASEESYMRMIQSSGLKDRFWKTLTGEAKEVNSLVNRIESSSRLRSEPIRNFMNIFGWQGRPQDAENFLKDFKATWEDLQQRGIINKKSDFPETHSYLDFFKREIRQQPELREKVLQVAQEYAAADDGDKLVQLGLIFGFKWGDVDDVQLKNPLLHAIGQNKSKNCLYALAKYYPINEDMSVRNDFKIKLFNLDSHNRFALIHKLLDEGDLKEEIWFGEILKNIEENKPVRTDWEGVLNKFKERNVDLNKSFENNKFPIDYALDFPDLLNYMLENGAEIYHQTIDLRRSEFGGAAQRDSPLVSALRKGNEEVVETLIRAGVDSTERIEIHQYNFLKIAIMEQPELAIALIDRIEDQNLLRSVVPIAFNTLDLMLVKKIINKLNQPLTEIDVLAIVTRISREKGDKIANFLKMIYYEKIYKVMPCLIHHLVRNIPANMDGIDLLLNVIDIDEEHLYKTALWTALETSNVKWVEKLIVNGASLTSLDRDGKSLLEVAREKNHPQIIELLTKKKMI